MRHARTRHGASVRGYTRRRFRCRSMPLQWRHLRFTIQRRWSPKEDGRYYSTSFCDLSIPARGVLNLNLLDGGELVGGDVVYLNQDVPRVQARSRRDSPRFRRRLRQTGQAPSPRMLPPLLVYSYHCRFPFLVLSGVQKLFNLCKCGGFAPPCRWFPYGAWRTRRAGAQYACRRRDHRPACVRTGSVANHTWLEGPPS